MYEIKRENGRVIIRKGSAAQPILSADETSFVIFEQDGKRTVSRLKDLTDEQLLMALASPVPLNL